MIQRVSRVRNLRPQSFYIDEDIQIDLGKEFEGTLQAKMERDDDDTNTRTFTILNSRYLFLSKEKNNDIIENEVNKKIVGKWRFDVRQLSPGKNFIVYSGTVNLIKNITE